MSDNQGGNVSARRSFEVIAGPCAIESRDQFAEVVDALYRVGVRTFRGGAFKPRTRAGAFEGLGFEGLAIAKDVLSSYADAYFITELLDPRDVKPALEQTDVIDVVQIGARSMQNIPLLKEVAAHGRPILLKRGFGNTWAEVSGAISHIRSVNPDTRVLVMERGIRTFEGSLRYTLDLAGALRFKLDNPGVGVFIDPSHATGDPELVEPLTMAAYAAGFDGAMIEVHANPCEALCDGKQAASVELVAGIISALEG